MERRKGKERGSSCSGGGGLLDAQSSLFQCLLSRSLSVSRQTDQFDPHVDIHLFNEILYGVFVVVVGVRRFVPVLRG